MKPAAERSPAEHRKYALGLMVDANRIIRNRLAYTLRRQGAKWETQRPDAVLGEAYMRTHTTVELNPDDWRDAATAARAAASKLNLLANYAETLALVLERRARQRVANSTDDAVE